MNSKLKKLLLTGASTLIALAMVEAALRLADISYPNFYQVDPVLGITLRPDASGWNRTEGEVYVQINQAGFRDDFHPIEKPPNTVRIAVLGDSYSEAIQVELDKTFWSIMEKELPQCPAIGGQSVEVLNFGVSGYGTAQELLLLRARVWEYEPDIVILAVTAENDISDNYRDLKLVDYVPYFDLVEGAVNDN